MSGCGLKILILNWNGKGVIEDCLDSVLAAGGDFEVTVVDNGSTDGSPEEVRRLFPLVEVIENGENLLFAAGNNVGIREALEEGCGFLLLLNNDTEVDPEFAVNMMKAFDDPEVGIAGPRIYYHDDPHRIWYGGGGFQPVTGLPYHRHIRRLDREARDERGGTGWVTGCAMMIRRDVIEDIGLLDPSYRIYCEDVDYCLRASRAGWKVVYEPSARVWHKVSSSSGGGMTPFKLENRIASTWRLFSRHRPLWWRVLVAPVHAFGFVLLLAGLLLGGRMPLLKAALRGLRRAAGG